MKCVECKKPAKYECDSCLSIFCKDCAEKLDGECLYCDPPRLRIIEKKKK